MEAKWTGFIMVVSIVWALWINRNEVWWFKKESEAIDPMVHTLFGGILGSFGCTVEVFSASGVKWLLPLAPSYKTNADGAIFSDKKEAEVVVIIRDHSENFIVGLNKKIQVPMEAVEVEAKAFETSIVFAEEVGF